MKPTIKPAFRSTFHRDGSVSLWDCLTQSWVRGRDFEPATLATLSHQEADRVLRHTGRHTR